MKLLIVTIITLVLSVYHVYGQRSRKFPSNYENETSLKENSPKVNSKSDNMTTYLGHMEKGNCMLAYEMVSIRDQLPDYDHSLYYPTCVKVKRCKGCCMGNRRCFSIRPSYKSFKIMKVNKSGYKEVFVQEDSRCACGCKIQKKECSFENALYDEMKCTCGCSNKEEKSKCEEMSETHLWNSSSCKCVCVKKKRHCSSGEFWDEEMCRCRSMYDPDDFDWTFLNEIRDENNRTLSAGNI